MIPGRVNVEREDLRGVKGAMSPDDLESLDQLSTETTLLESMEVKVLQPPRISLVAYLWD